MKGKTGIMSGWRGRLACMTLALLAGVATCIPAAAQYAADSRITLVPPGGSARFGREYFGMHVHYGEREQNWPRIAFGSWRMWDANIGWAKLEPSQGIWNFDKLDLYVARAASASVSVLLPLGVTPTWASARPTEMGAYNPGSAAEPANLELWRNYVRRVATRYAGRVAAYQVLNEANFPSFWTGGIPKLVELTAIAREEIRRADPAAVLVMPSGVGLDQRISWVRDFLDAGGAKVVDVASYHLYHYYVQPEVIVPRMLEMRRQLAASGHQNMPLWNTETGYYFANIGGPPLNWTDDEAKRQIDRDVAARYLLRATLLARALGFERFYWYAWDNDKMGFMEPRDRSMRPHAKALEQFINLMLRAELRRCERASSGLWSCDLVLAGNRNARAVWVDDLGRPQKQALMVPAGAIVQGFDGGPAQRMEAGGQIEVDGAMRLVIVPTVSGG